MMRLLFVSAIAACLCTSSVMAADVATGPLAPGKPAGVQQAQRGDNTLLYVLGAGAVIAGIVLLANNGSSKAAATTGTNP